jgi:hypothetical protein
MSSSKEVLEKFGDFAVSVGLLRTEATDSKDLSKD